MALLGISGYIYSGKDYTAQFMVKEFLKDYQIRKFATGVKQVASLLSGVPVIKFEDPEFKKQQMPNEWGMTYREFLQKIGTDALRNGLHENTWVNLLFKDYQAMINYEDPKGNVVHYVDMKSYDNGYYKTVLPSNWIITDVRFPNEAQAIKDRGGFVIRKHGNQSMMEMAKLHESETALWNWKYDYEIPFCRTDEELVAEIKKCLIKLKFITNNYA